VGKIEILSTHNLLSCKLGAVCQKLATLCLVTFQLTTPCWLD